ncbi:HEAT-STRESS-ASSOCIATED 32-like protein [Drosera capensis]
MAALRWKSFTEYEDRTEKTRRYGLTEIRAPSSSSLFSDLVLQESLLRFVRLIKSAGMRAKPQFALKCNKFDIPGGRNRAYVVPSPRSEEFVQDVDFLIGRAERFLEAGADMIMIDAEDVCQHADSMRGDIIAKIVGCLGIEKTMFDASDAKTFEWLIRQYGPKVNQFVDHSQVGNLECLRGHLEWITLDGFPIKADADCKREATATASRLERAFSIMLFVSGFVVAVCATDESRSSKLVLKVHEPTRRKTKSSFNDSTIDGVVRRTRKKQTLPVHDSIADDYMATTGRVGRDVQKRSGRWDCSAVEGVLAEAVSPGYRLGSSFRSLSRMGSTGYVKAICNQCGERLARRECVEEHDLSKHAVTEVTEADMSRKIIEKILKTGWSSSSSMNQHIESILKVRNLQTRLTQFEEYRETVKIRATRSPKRYLPRCCADGNELLRFHGTTTACSLGQNSNGLCTLEKCNVCNILRHGYSSKRHWDRNRLGMFTASSSEVAYRHAEANTRGHGIKTALIICRVIAGRVQMPTAAEGSIKERRRLGFDSVAWKMGHCSCFEELYSLSPGAILPCFVIIFKP